MAEDLKGQGPSPRVERSEGQTPTERFLKELCDKAFLRLWSYPGVYKDQGEGVRAGGEGKEVCDLLVVFGNHVLIFSDKYCRFKTTGDLETNWRRWFRSTISASARQVWGAERWIKTFPKRLFLDRRCKKTFPLDLPSSDHAVFHRIVVAHGISEACRRTLGGTGSLMLSSHLIGEDAHKDPFHIGWPGDPARGFVHVFDDATLIFVLKTLDTITDFIAYLTKKESLFRNKRVVAAGEEELLAFYLKHLNDAREHDFVIPNGCDAIVLDEGHWANFVERPERKA